ncbi:hypothetical protein [Rufibacter soli]
MKRTGLTFMLALLLFVPNRVFSQDHLQEPAVERMRVHLAPLNFFDPVTAVLQVGAQKQLSDRFSLSLDHGFKSFAVKKLMERENERQNQRYSKTKVEIKYFLGRQNQATLSRVFPYLSVEGMYFPQEYSKENDWIHKESASYMYAYSYINRKVWVASLKYGKETRYRKVVIDKFIGIGVRYMSIRHRQTTGEVEGIYDEPTDISFPPIDRQEGTFWRPHISLGVKFGLPFQ